MDKSPLAPFVVMAGASLAAPFRSKISDVKTKDNICYQVVVTAPASGTFSVDGSIDGVNWVSHGSLTVSGNDILLFDVNQFAAPKISLSWSGSGTGSASATITAKEV